MASVETRITCGGKTIFTQQFNDQTTVQQIRDQIDRACGEDILQPYRILHYDTHTMELNDLEGQLQGRPSVFRLPPANGISPFNATNPSNCVQLILVRDRSEPLTDPSDTGRFDETTRTIHSEISLLESAFDSVSENDEHLMESSKRCLSETTGRRCDASM